MYITHLFPSSWTQHRFSATLCKYINNSSCNPNTCGNQMVPINHSPPCCFRVRKEVQQPLKKLWLDICMHLHMHNFFLSPNCFAKAMIWLLTNAKEGLSSARSGAFLGRKKATLPQKFSAGPVEQSASWGCSYIIFSFILCFPFFRTGCLGRPHKAPSLKEVKSERLWGSFIIVRGAGLNSVGAITRCLF